MDVIRETRTSEIEAHLNQVIARGKMDIDKISSNIPSMFRDDTLFYRDNDIGFFVAFSLRGEFWEWSWGAGVGAPNDIQMEALLRLVMADAAVRWGENLPFSFFYNKFCPTFIELTDGGRDLKIADDIVLAMNRIKRDSAVRIIPAQDFNYQRGRHTTVLEGVVAHSKPLLFDRRLL